MRNPTLNPTIKQVTPTLFARKTEPQSHAHDVGLDNAVNARMGSLNWVIVVAVTIILGALFGWAYWPTIIELTEAWDRLPDYSHGYLVAPLAVFFLWARRDRFPATPGRARWAGALLIVGSIGIRYIGAKYYLGGVDGWSILFWVAGVVLLFGGHRVLMWAAPSIVFLLFMVPLPYSAERMFSLPLQKLATWISCWTLQFLGQPAIAQGNTILLGDYTLEVAEACSGLRIFMGILALAFAYLVIVRGPWWQKMILAASTLPVALVANAARIVVTGLLYQWVSGGAAEKFSHDMAGWIMIPFAALLFAMVLWYVRSIVQEVEVLDVRSLVLGDADQHYSRSKAGAQPTELDTDKQAGG